MYKKSKDISKKKIKINKHGNSYLFSISFSKIWKRNY